MVVMRTSHSNRDDDDDGGRNTTPPPPVVICRANAIARSREEQDDDGGVKREKRSLGSDLDKDAVWVYQGWPWMRAFLGTAQKGWPDAAGEDYMRNFTNAVPVGVQAAAGFSKGTLLQA